MRQAMKTLHMISLCILGWLSLLTACAKPTLPPPPPQEVIAKAGERMQSLASFHFVIERSGAPAYLDPGNTLVLSRMEGDYQTPDRAQGQVRVIGPGIVASVRFINIGVRYWETNLLSGEWAECPAAQCFNPALLFDTQAGLPAILQQDLSALAAVESAELEEMPGKRLYHLRGELQGARLAELSWGMIGPESMAAQLWVDPETFDLYRVQLEEPTNAPDAPTPAAGDPTAATLWKVDFLQFNQPLEILPPASATPTP